MGRALAILATAILLLAYPLVAQANGLPTRWIQPGTGIILPAEHPLAAVVSEDLTITIARPTPRMGSNVTVRACYSLRLVDGAPAQDIQVAFIHNGWSSTWNVTLDDKPVTVEENGPASVAGLSLERKTYDPLTGQEYNMMPGPGRQAGASFFRVRLEPGKTHNLEVEYVTRSGWDELRYVNPICHFTYYLRPAKNWAGFGNLSVTLRVPWGYRVVTSLDGQLSRQGPGLLRGTFEGLPADDLHVSIMSGLGMLPGIATRGGAAILWLSSLSLYLAVLALGSPRRVVNLSGLFLAVVSAWALTRRLWLYPLDLLQTPVLLVILAWIGVSLWKRNRA